MNQIQKENRAVTLGLFIVASVLYLIRAVFSAPDSSIIGGGATWGSSLHVPFASWSLSITLFLLVAIGVSYLSGTETILKYVGVIYTFIVVTNIHATLRAFDSLGGSLETVGWVGAIFQLLFFAAVVALLVVNIINRERTVPEINGIKGWSAAGAYVGAVLSILFLAFTAGSYEFTWGGFKADEFFLRVQPLETIGLLLAIVATAALTFFGIEYLYSALAGLVVVALSYSWVYIAFSTSLLEEMPADVWMIFSAIFALAASGAYIVSLSSYLKAREDRKV